MVDENGSGETFSMTPIGSIHTPFSKASGTPVQGRMARATEGEVRLDPRYADGLSDLDGFSHIVLLFAFHASEGYKLTVTPYLDPEPRGLFATRAPRRPNPIGMTVVRLLSIDGCTLHVRGVDMFDGTPLLDIKPYVPLFDVPGEVKCGWLEPHMERLQASDEGPVADDRFHRS